MRFQKWGWIAVFGCFGAASWSWAAGRARTPAPSPVGVGVQTQPIRHVKLAKVWTRPFTFPNGARIDLQYDLDQMFRTAVIDTAVLAPFENAADVPDACDVTLEIRAAVSTADFFNTELGLRFGYTPTGELGNLTGLRGAITARIGTLGMDFSLWQCSRGKCAAFASARSDTRTTQVDGNLQIDLGLITTGPGFVTHTAFGAALRKLMREGLAGLTASARLPELAWQATVREVDLATGRIVIDAGSQARVALKQKWTVYAALDPADSHLDSDPRCRVYKPMAYAETQSVESLSSAAVIQTVLDPRGVRVGDVVTLR